MIINVIDLISLLGEYLMPSDKYRMEEIDVNTYTTRLRLHLRLSSMLDEGAYKCAAKNSIGDSEGSVQVYGDYFHSFWPRNQHFDFKIPNFWHILTSNPKFWP